MHQKKLYGTATVGTKGQIVIPARAREILNLKSGDELYVVGMPGGNMLALLTESSIEAYIQKLNLHLEQLQSVSPKTKKTK
jgi:AbrB family looped-hinge helix DNA binding protein